MKKNSPGRKSLELEDVPVLNEMGFALEGPPRRLSLDFLDLPVHLNKA
jgi:hypothetical protein